MKEKVLNWAQQFNTFCFLDNHGYQILPHTQECLLAAGVRTQVSAHAGSALHTLQSFIDGQPHRWLFGHLAFELKNEIDTPGPDKKDNLHFPDLSFFQPEVVIKLAPDQLTIEAEDPAAVFAGIHRNNTARHKPETHNSSSIKSRLSQQEYLSIIRQLQQHILRGDCYEINFCQEFFAENAHIDPLEVYRRLSTVSPNPFSALYRLEDKWLICASPERFLKKQGSRILSQPIKGTTTRILHDKVKDQQSRETLFTSAKDRSENVMVVDLVRNDLARICKEGTVKVDELYGIYSFPQVHQMISTISGELDPVVNFTDVLRATFPMGSMTGAPKKKVMELIDRYETGRRGVFSGALGYISPTGDFDFNVVIRSILYNATSGYLSFPAGSGITFYSEPEKEWEECLLKAAAIRQVLSRS